MKDSANNIDKTRLYCYAYDFSIDFESMDFDHISDIYKYLKRKNDIK